MINTSQDTSDIFTAICKAQGEFPSIPKNRTVDVKSREGKFLYSFDYADLAQIITSVRPTLMANGLSFTQSLTKTENMGLGYVTRIMHLSGQWLDTGFVPAILSENSIMKDVAGNVTYGKRLSLSEALGVSADDDIDAPPTNDESLDLKPKVKISQKPSPIKPVASSNIEDPWETKIPSTWKSDDAGKSFRDIKETGVRRLVTFLETKAPKTDQNKMLLFTARVCLETPIDKPFIADDWDTPLDAVLAAK